MQYGRLINEIILDMNYCNWIGHIVHVHHLSCVNVIYLFCFSFMCRDSARVEKGNVFLIPSTSVLNTVYKRYSRTERTLSTSSLPLALLYLIDRQISIFNY